MSSNGARTAERRVDVRRYTPLRKSWPTIVTPLVEQLKLQVRFNPRTRSVEIRSDAAAPKSSLFSAVAASRGTSASLPRRRRRAPASATYVFAGSPATGDKGAVQKGADFVAAFALGFEVADALALLRLEDLFVDSFEVKDVKILRGDHLSRAVGRVAGADGKTRFAIENATRTRIVVANTHIHILGSASNIKVARDAICDLIIGAPPGKVYNRMRTVAKRLQSRL